MNERRDYRASLMPKPLNIAKRNENKHNDEKQQRPPSSSFSSTIYSFKSTLKNGDVKNHHQNDYYYYHYPSRRVVDVDVEEPVSPLESADACGLLDSPVSPIFDDDYLPAKKHDEYHDHHGSGYNKIEDKTGQLVLSPEWDKYLSDWRNYQHHNNEKRKTKKRFLIHSFEDTSTAVAESRSVSLKRKQQNDLQSQPLIRITKRRLRHTVFRPRLSKITEVPEDIIHLTGSSNSQSTYIGRLEFRILLPTTTAAAAAATNNNDYLPAENRVTTTIEECLIVKHLQLRAFNATRGGTLCRSFKYTAPKFCFRMNSPSDMDDSKCNTLPGGGMYVQYYAIVQDISFSKDPYDAGGGDGGGDDEYEIEGSLHVWYNQLQIQLKRSRVDFEKIRRAPGTVFKL